MRYLGGKSKIARSIALAILSSTPRRERYVEPFVGGGAVFEELAPHFRVRCAGDAHLDLVLMWQAVRAGWVPPAHVSEEEYRVLKNYAPSALRGFVGFGCSFGALWFGTYARDGAGGTARNFADESSRAAVRLASLLATAEVRHADYAEWLVGAGDVVYADPPYAGTEPYDGTAPFDHHRFWSVMDSWVNGGGSVFVSEYSAPPHWREVGAAEHRQSVAGGQRQKATVERLFTRERRVAQFFSRTGVQAR